MVRFVELFSEDREGVVTQSRPSLALVLSFFEIPPSKFDCVHTHTLPLEQSPSAALLSNVVPTTAVSMNRLLVAISAMILRIGPPFFFSR
jgi:hypothetical protein